MAAPGFLQLLGGREGTIPLAGSLAVSTIIGTLPVGVDKLALVVRNDSVATVRIRRATATAAQGWDQIGPQSVATIGPLDADDLTTLVLDAPGALAGADVSIAPCAIRGDYVFELPADAGADANVTPGDQVPDAILSTWRVNDPASGIFSTEGSADPVAIAATVQAAIDYVSAASTDRTGEFAWLYVDSFYFDTDDGAGNVATITVGAGVSLRISGITGDYWGLGGAAWITAHWAIAGTVLFERVTLDNYLGGSTPDGDATVTLTGNAAIEFVESTLYGLNGIVDGSGLNAGRAIMLRECVLAPADGGTRAALLVPTSAFVEIDGGATLDEDSSQPLVHRTGAGAGVLRMLGFSSVALGAATVELLRLRGATYILNGTFSRLSAPVVDFVDAGSHSIDARGVTWWCTDDAVCFENTAVATITLNLSGCSWYAGAGGQAGYRAPMTVNVGSLSPVAV